MVVQDQPADLEVQLILSANPALLEGGKWEVTGQGWGRHTGPVGYGRLCGRLARGGMEWDFMAKNIFALDFFFQIFIYSSQLT